MVQLHRVLQLAAVLAVGALVSAARADISVIFEEFRLGGSANADTLNTNGWVGVRISAVSSDANAVGGFDLDTGVRGITGTFVQFSTTQDQLGNPTPATSTPQGITPTTAPGTTVNQQDSFFSTFPGLSFAAQVALAENINTALNQVATNPPYTYAPLADTAAIDYGLGTRLNGAGTFNLSSSTTIPIAFVIVPVGSQIHVVGQFANNNQAVAQGFLVDQTFTAVPVPEPASLAMLGAGALALLARRRR